MREFPFDGTLERFMDFILSESQTTPRKPRNVVVVGNVELYQNCNIVPPFDNSLKMV
jgi:hypothetical protein